MSHLPPRRAPPSSLARPRSVSDAPAHQTRSRSRQLQQLPEEDPIYDQTASMPPQTPSAPPRMEAETSTLTSHSNEGAPTATMIPGAVVLSVIEDLPPVPPSDSTSRFQELQAQFENQQATIWAQQQQLNELRSLLTPVAHSPRPDDTHFSPPVHSSMVPTFAVPNPVSTVVPTSLVHYMTAKCCET